MPKAAPNSAPPLPVVTPKSGQVSWAQASVATAPSYNPKQLYTNSTDPRGHGVGVSAQIPPTLKARMAEMVQSQDFPGYLTIEDVLRDFIVHGLHMRDEDRLDPAFRRAQAKFWNELSIHEEVEAEHQAMLRWQKSMEAMVDVCGAYVADEDWGSLEGTIAHYSEIADGFSDHRRAKWLEMLAGFEKKIPSGWSSGVPSGSA